MAQELLFNKTLKRLHIALFLLIALFGFQAKAQSVMLPGDVVVVSANADNPSIDFIPLIDLEKGTTFYFSDGLWDETAQTLTGNEFKLTFLEPVQAGTNIQINNTEDTRFTATGDLKFQEDTHRLFIYQKEQEVYRFIFAVGWGKGHIWNTPEQSEIGSDIPINLLETPHTYLTLGEEPNQQYYIRNGASGTKNMLLAYVGDSTNWRGNDSEPFSLFGTSFNLKVPPVIVFDSSVSTVQESDSIAILKVAIYEHDGSRVSVDVTFDSLRSIASADDFGGFDRKTINFTGLVGDYTHKVSIPIDDDDVFKGRRTGIFTLENLSGGNFGDFLSHNLVIEDDEQAEVLISRVVNGIGRPGFIEIKNMEEEIVSLSNWTLSGKDMTFTFTDDVILLPGEPMKWFDTSEISIRDPSEKAIASNLKEQLLKVEGGILTLRNYAGRIAHQVSYSRARRANRHEAGGNDLAVTEVISNNQGEQITGNLLNTTITAMQLSNSGWKVMSNSGDLKAKFSNKSFYVWSEEQQAFRKDTESAISAKDQVIFAYFEKDEGDELTAGITQSLKKEVTDGDLSFTVSATDRNDNGILDGLEGLNLVYNNLNKDIAVHSFLELAKSEYPDLPLSSSVYGIKQEASGEINFTKLDKDQKITAKTPFWLMLDSSYPSKEISLNEDELNSNIDLTEASSEQNEHGLLELTLKTESHDEVVQVHFNNEEEVNRVKDLNSYPELFLPDQSFLNFSFRQGEDFYNAITLSSEIEQPINLPVHISGSTSGEITFSVTEWDYIPADWGITLRDLTTDKEYNLRRDFSVTVEHDFPVLKAKNEGDISLTESQNSDDERFMLSIAPLNSSTGNDEEISDKPRELELHQNYPNPFNPVTTISFYLPQPEEVKLSVFNIVGQPVAVIVEGTLSAGQKQFEWDATDKPSGMYIYQLEVGKKVMTRKMTLVK